MILNEDDQIAFHLGEGKLCVFDNFSQGLTTMICKYGIDAGNGSTIDVLDSSDCKLGEVLLHIDISISFSGYDWQQILSGHRDKNACDTTIICKKNANEAVSERTGQEYEAKEQNGGIGWYRIRVRNIDWYVDRKLKIGSLEKLEPPNHSAPICSGGGNTLPLKS